MGSNDVDVPAVGELELQKTATMRATGSGSGNLTIPKAVAQPLLETYGNDYAVFSDGAALLIVPRAEVTVDV